jgi:pheromone shutdown protein TraB
MMGIVVFLLSRGDYTSLKETAYDWLLLNAVLAALAVLLVRGHPVAILTAGIASPITSLNPTLAAGWFAGAAQMRYAAPTGRDLSDFLMLDRFSLFWSNRVGRVLLVTVAGNIGSSVGAILAGSWIISSLFS